MTTTHFQEASPNGASLYRLWDRKGRLLYVGITGRGVKRMFEHSRSKSWWSDVASMTVVHYSSPGEASAAELLAIMSERPRHNKKDTYHWNVAGARWAALYGGVFNFVFVVFLTFIVTSASQSLSAVWSSAPWIALAIGVCTVGAVSTMWRIFMVQPGRARAGWDWSVALLFLVSSITLQIPSRMSFILDGIIPKWVGLIFWLSLCTLPLQLLYLWSGRADMYRGLALMGGLGRRTGTKAPLGGQALARAWLRHEVSTLRRRRAAKSAE